MYPNPPMPPRRTIGARLRNLSLPLKLLAGGGAGLALLLVCFCALAALGAVLSIGKPGNATSTTPTAALVQGTTPTPTATFTPTATPTPAGPRIITDATFGGTTDAFQAAYGDPLPHGTGTARQYRFSAGSITGIVRVVPDTGTDGKQHILSLVVGPASGSWSETTARQALALFLPKDAKYLKNVQIFGQTERLYLSADLGKTFPADDFGNQATAKPVTPGTFWAYYNPKLDGSYVCQLGE